MGTKTYQDLLSREDGPVTCLVILIGSLGDTLKSLMALRAAKQLYPQLQLNVIVRDANRDCVERVDWIHKIFVLDEDVILKETDETGGTKGAVQAVARWIRPIAARSWDIIANWSYTDASSYLAAILHSPVKLGYTRRSDLSISCADEWSHYVQAIVQGEVDQNIHMIDIYTTQLLTALQINYGEPKDCGNEAVTCKGFFNINGASFDSELNWKYSSQKWIAIQLQNPDSPHRWSTHRWSHLIDQILRRHPDYSVFVLGEMDTETTIEELQTELKKNSIPHLNRVVFVQGQCGFDLQASIVSRAHWLISANHAGVHLASVLGTRVVFLDIRSEDLNHVAPYGNGHYVVRETDPGRLDADGVYGIWSYASSEWSHRRSKSLTQHFSQLSISERLEHIDVMRSRIRPSNAGGGVVYESLLDRKLVLRDWLGMVMGQIARSWYCGWVAPVGHELVRERISAELLSNLRKIAECSEVLTKICEDATATATMLAEKTSRLRSDRIMGMRDRKVIQELGTRLQELDQLIDRMAVDQEPFRAFSQMARVMMNNLSGRKLSEMGRESAQYYRRLGSGVKILRDWIGHTLELARPHPISKSKPHLVEKDI